MNSIKLLTGFLILFVFLWGCSKDINTPADSPANSLQNSRARTNNDLLTNDAVGNSFQITIENLTPAGSQPFSPPVLAIHRPSIRMFQVGKYASDELRQIAEDALNGPMVNLLNESKHVYGVVTGSAPIPPGNSATFTIDARAGFPKLSFVSMLVNTNDAFTGINAVQLQREGSAEYYLNAYDAGTEINTELAAHIPGPCCGNPLVRVPSNERIEHHSGILGVGDLDPNTYGWTDPVAKLTITHIN